MPRNVCRARKFDCLDCGHSFVATFWSAKLMAGDPLGRTFDTRGDVRCDNCNSHKVTADRHIERCTPKSVARIRESMRPVVYRWHDSEGREHFRYPATNDPSTQRPGEERVEFDTLSSMRSFLKEQNPTHADWQVPLNDILEYDHAHIDIPAMDTSDPGVAEEADEILSVDDFGVSTAEEVAAFNARTDGRALIEAL